MAAIYRDGVCVRVLGGSDTSRSQGVAVSRGRPRIEDQRPEVVEVVGRFPDAQAAAMLGVSKSCVTACRNRLGLAPVDVDGLHLRIHELEQVIERLLVRLKG